MIRTKENNFTGRHGSSIRRNHRGVLVPLAMHHLLDKAIKESWLPHGSGIDLDWVLVGPNTHHNLRLLNSYHCMDDVGYYRKWQDFQIVFSRYKDWLIQVPDTTMKDGDKVYVKYRKPVRVAKLPEQDRLHIVAHKGNWDWVLKWSGDIVRNNYAYGLRDYLIDTLNIALEPLCGYANGTMTMDDVMHDLGMNDFATFEHMQPPYDKDQV